MALYLYSYLNLFGYTGSGTPEDPGTDFGMSVWIEAPDEQAALDWGHLVLADYVRARYRHDGSATDIDPSGIEGWIEEDETALKDAEGRFPRCRVGEIPTWQAPLATSQRSAAIGADGGRRHPVIKYLGLF